MSVLLDTHFLIWITLGSARLSEFPWLDGYRPWGVSPISFLEIQFLSEIGRIQVNNPEFTHAVSQDRRFIVDDVPLLRLIRHGLSFTWTRDPFDRLLVAHSTARRMELCTTDRSIRDHYVRIVKELRF